jgi:hypothetical protein
MEPDLESGYLKLYRMGEKTPVAVRGKNEKQSKLPQTITISSELRFGKTIVNGKVLRRRSHLSTLNFELSTTVSIKIKKKNCSSKNKSNEWKLQLEKVVTFLSELRMRHEYSHWRFVSERNVSKDQNLD